MCCIYIYIYIRNILQQQLNKKFGSKIDDIQNEMPPRKYVFRLSMRRIPTNKRLPRTTAKLRNNVQINNNVQCQSVKASQINGVITILKTDEKH